MGSATLQSTDLTDAQFNKISILVKDLCGISLSSSKKGLVQARLNKHLRKLGFSNYDEYIEHIRRDRAGDELTAMLDAISTNLTSFFREADHFEYLGREVLGRIATRAAAGSDRRLRIWSAGCSSGEEPYSLAITVNENIPNIKAWDAAILATDLSTEILDRAKKGVYSAERIKAVPPQLRQRYMRCTETRPERIYQVNENLRSLVHFSRLNLMGSWPMQGPFDVIFCRNVMIYFDKSTQRRLVERFRGILSPGGTLFIGHSESLGANHSFRYIQPTVYEKR